MGTGLMRKKLVNLHLWLGLTVGLFWALQGLGGALLVFHREIGRLGGPVVSTGPMASLDLIAERAGAAAGAPIERIGVFDSRGDLLLADYHDEAGTLRSKLIDAAQAEVVGEREAEPSRPTGNSFWPWLYRFHDSLAGGEESAAIIGVSGFILITSLVAGLWIAWPKRAAWRVMFDVRRWRSTDQRLYGWHRAIGLIVGFALLITVPCGIYLVFAADVRPQIARLVPHSLPYSAVPVSILPDELITPQRAYQIAHAPFPEAAFVSVAMPSAKKPVYTLRLRQAAEPRAWAGTTSVVVDAASGETLHVYDAVRAPLSNRVADAAFPIHSGEISGLPGRVLIMLAGLSLPTLYVTGIWAWFRRYKRQKKKRKTQPRAKLIPDVKT